MSNGSLLCISTEVLEVDSFGSSDGSVVVKEGFVSLAAGRSKEEVGQLNSLLTHRGIIERTYSICHRSGGFDRVRMEGLKIVSWSSFVSLFSFPPLPSPGWPSLTRFPPISSLLKRAKKSLNHVVEM